MNRSVVEMVSAIPKGVKARNHAVKIVVICRLGPIANSIRIVQRISSAMNAPHHLARIAMIASRNVSTMTVIRHPLLNA